MSRYNNKKERGVILPIVGLTLAVLLGMAGLVIDLGAMFVAKTELQSAVDSCALAAAQELDGAADALTRGTSAGLTAGNANKVQYQKASASLVDTDVTFSDSLTGAFSSTFAPVANARYAKCSHLTSGIVAYLIQMVGGPTSNAVAAVGVATRTHAQSTCPILLACYRSQEALLRTMASRLANGFRYSTTEPRRPVPGKWLVQPRWFDQRQ